MLSKILKELREARNLSQTDVAKVLNITRQAYNHYETGVRLPSLESLIMIADYFDVSTDYLLGRNSLDKETTKAKSGLTENESELIELINKVTSEREKIKAIGKFEEIVKNMITESSSELALTTELASNKKRA